MADTITLRYGGALCPVRCGLTLYLCPNFALTLLQGLPCVAPASTAFSSLSQG
jgi:hypothetical protein